ncbi:hypothetical protein MLD38_007414 [Melastoma candidum]|uniref:Uncharacterized protein n=1 Tax=Melastoma candidum TaxID=119954 RepID=A0ACB9RRK5_9MYRT|nr:hypothetical protein MLD38_007414 [Melastoma candidum]
MADASTVELLDFFSLEKDPNNNSYNNKTSVHPSIDRRSSFKGIQNVISKISPQLLKSVIASSSSVPCNPHVIDWDTPPPVPSRASDGETMPLTIFYNGSLMVFDLPPHKAEGILKLAVSGRRDSVLMKNPEITTAVSAGDHRDLLGTLTRDLPMLRRKSLQRFLEKRKERLTSSTPYYYAKTE